MEAHAQFWIDRANQLLKLVGELQSKNHKLEMDLHESQCRAGCAEAREEMLKKILNHLNNIKL